MWIKAMTVLGAVRPMRAIAVNQACSRIGEVAVPDFVGTFRKIETRNFAAAARIEQTKLDTLGVCRKYCKVCSEAIPSGA